MYLEIGNHATKQSASYDKDKQKALDSISFWKGAMIRLFFNLIFMIREI